MMTQQQREHSGIYTGIVGHRRMATTSHAFSYRVFMMYLDLDEVEQVFARSRLWSCKHPALAWFRRKDFLGDAQQSLKSAVRQRIREATGQDFKGPVRLLCNLRYFGYLINPISVYFCFSPADDNELQYIIAEVTNTPWGERHSYVLRCKDGQPEQHIVFAKQLHVSPFFPMNMAYEWRSTLPGEQIAISLASLREGRCEFSAWLQLQHQPASAANLRRILLTYPFMTARVAAGIYWQALKLFIKRTPFFRHPRKPADTSATAATSASRDTGADRPFSEHHVKRSSGVLE